MALYDRHSDALCAQEIQSFLVVIPLLKRILIPPCGGSNRPTIRQGPVLYARQPESSLGEAVYEPRHFRRLGPVTQVS